jgi:hypothetical protein
MGAGKYMKLLAGLACPDRRRTMLIYMRSPGCLELFLVALGAAGVQKGASLFSG